MPPPLTPASSAPIPAPAAASRLMAVNRSTNVPDPVSLYANAAGLLPLAAACSKNLLWVVGLAATSLANPEPSFALRPANLNGTAAILPVALARGFPPNVITSTTLPSSLDAVLTISGTSLNSFGILSLTALTACFFRLPAPFWSLADPFTMPLAGAPINFWPTFSLPAKPEEASMKRPDPNSFMFRIWSGISLMSRSLSPSNISWKLKPSPFLSLMFCKYLALT